MKAILTQLFGEAVTEDALKQFNSELGKKFVAKADYNSKLEEIKGLKTDKESLETQISEMTDKASTANDYKSQLEALQKQIKDKEEAERLAAEDQALTDSIVSVIGDKKFTSDYVRNGIIADMKAEIKKPENIQFAPSGNSLKKAPTKPMLVLAKENNLDAEVYS